MKARQYAMVMMFMLTLTGLCTGCAIPRRMWPQADVAPSRVGSAVGGQTVLLASRSSKFKEVLVEKITSAVTAENMAVAIIGIEDLKTTEAENYAAVVIISTCLAWGVDPLVREFIDGHLDYNRLVLVITSDSGWLPKKSDLDVDAMTSASVLTDADTVSRQVMIRLMEKLDRN